MTARLVAAHLLCIPWLAVLAGCGGDATPVEDATASVTAANTGHDAQGNAEDAVFDQAAPADNQRGLNRIEPADDEFAAAPPLRERQIAPLETLHDRRPPTYDPAIVERKRTETRITEEDVARALVRQPNEQVRDRPPRKSQPEEELFAAAPVGTADRGGEPLDDGDEFAAAPPVPITDAAAPIPGVEPAPSPDASPADAVPPETSPRDHPYWPRFHGPRGDNKSTDTGLLKRWPEHGPPLVWTTTGIGYGYSSISIANGLIYTAGNQDDKTIISAINLNGGIEWQMSNGGAWTESFEGTRGTPTIDGERLYHQSPLGNVVCLKARNGEPIWGLNSLERFGGRNITWALAESLLVDGDHVICCPGGVEASMVALNKMTGETVWTAEPTGDQAGYSTPTLAEQGGLRMIFVMTSQSVIAVDADSGRLLFRHPFATQYNVNVLKPLFHDGHLFVSGGYGTTGSQLLKIEVADGSVSVEVVWESKDLDNHHGGVLLIEGYLFGAAHKFNNAKWICLDWETGEMRWAERGIGKGSLTYADGLLYLLSEKKTVGLAAPSPEGHEVISQFRLPAGGTGSSWAHPVVCGGRLYLRHADRLFAYDVAARG